MRARGARTWRRRLQRLIVPHLGTALIRSLALSWRVRRVGGDAFDRWSSGQQAWVGAFWHGEMLPVLWAHRSSGIHILISRHGDGELITRVASRFGYQPVRGSSTRGGAGALRGILELLAQGDGVAFTPDGPRGPAHSFASGALYAAHRSGAPVFMVRAEVDRAWRLGSWDRFLIPKPFARVTLHYSPPIVVADGDVADIDVGRARFQRLLRGLLPGGGD